MSFFEGLKLFIITKNSIFIITELLAMALRHQKKKREEAEGKTNNKKVIPFPNEKSIEKKVV